MRRVAIVQARMGSTRLPGKVLMDLEGAPMLARQLARMKRMREVSEIVIATTTSPLDDEVVALAGREGVRWFRGDERDVLGRYLGAAREASADVVVRVTADCPLIDPEVADLTIRALGADRDYASNIEERTYPRGLDTEVLWRDTLERVGRLARSEPAREHVTWLILRERPELFVRASVRDAEKNDDLRWTVDTPEDLAVVRRIYAQLGLAEGGRSYREVLAHVRADPACRANADIVQKAV